MDARTDGGYERQLDPGPEVDLLVKELVGESESPGGPVNRRELTFGVEEEYHLVDAATLALRHAPEVVRAAVRRLGSHAQPEIGTAQLEISTPVCGSLSALRRALCNARANAEAAAAESGCHILAVGTHPFGRWHDQQLTPKARYLHLFERWGMLALQQTIAGCHVHVGDLDLDEAVAVADRVRPYLPVLLAITASSPFWEGSDTGYASYRSQWFSRWPLVGIPDALGSGAAYKDLIRQLTDIGIIDDPSHLYWDVRPSTHYPTIEFRIADVSPSLDTVVLLAALVRSLTRTMLLRYRQGEPAPVIRGAVLTAARWRAARHGLEETLVHPVTLQPIPAPEVVAALLDLLHEDLEAYGEWHEVSGLADSVLRHGTSAARQRAMLGRSGDLTVVTAALVAETARGLS